ncbi:uncharacterized protein A1O5_00071 [Cladophialophora psammophila CBS 110553]|uniref:SnoaL-like domain-containing protein n=1 Tax=Cladophialophora psammophila CBS 110553 TaxID=1182543 RepID=W9XE06_9EURO|nr:uncharacterized protein A1O5_00071 [Cladophialophora psammophila CBS 110553]EXJ75565.1 hypothetical protein A1O5_00071 [Cladophialophora psammophila CBS 110553]
MAVFLARTQTLHMFGPGDMRYLTPEKNEVEAIWSTEDQIIWKDENPPFQMRGGGYYYETWALKDGEWLVKSLRLERTYMKVPFDKTRTSRKVTAQITALNEVKI